MVTPIISGLFKATARATSWVTRGGRLTTLVYHRVLAQRDELLPDDTDQADFTWQMELVSEHFRVMPLIKAVRLLRAQSLPQRALAITFDDGYANNFTSALPVLQKFSLPATFFVSTGFIDGGLMWNDAIVEGIRAADSGSLDLSQCGLGTYALSGTESRRNAIDRLIDELRYRENSERRELIAEFVSVVGKPLPTSLMMTSAQIAIGASANVDFGAHTINHPILSLLDEDSARREIVDGRNQLRELTGRTIDLFAYPNGKPGRDYGGREVRLVNDSGFEAAFSTAWGTASPRSDPFQLPRFTPWDATPDRFLLRLAHNYLR